MDRKAVIDIGTNSIKLYVAERASDGSLASVLDKNNIARLGEGMGDTGILQPEAIARNAQAVAEFVGLARECGAQEIVAVGTMALRTARNASDLICAVQKLSGIDVRVIPGTKKRGLHISQFCQASALPPEAGCVRRRRREHGFIFGGDAGIDRRFSINLGAVKVSDQFLASDPPGPEQVELAMSFVVDALQANRVDAARPVDKLIGIGGTVTSMGSVKFKMAQ